jgi:hypothetical protein
MPLAARRLRRRAVIGPAPVVRTGATDSMCSRLARDTGCAAAEVEAAVDRAVSRFRGARVREFVTLLAEREARRELLASHFERVSTIGREGARGGMSGGGGIGQDDD